MLSPVLSGQLYGHFGGHSVWLASATLALLTVPLICLATRSSTPTKAQAANPRANCSDSVIAIIHKYLPTGAFPLSLASYLVNLGESELDFIQRQIRHPHASTTKGWKSAMSIFQRIVLLLKVLVMLPLGTSAAWAECEDHGYQAFSGPVAGQWHDDRQVRVRARRSRAGWQQG